MMKSLLLFLLFTSTTAAQIDFDEQRIEYRKMVSLYGLECVIAIRGENSENDQFTRLSLLRTPQDTSLEFKHVEATVPGCDINLLEALVTDSHTRFNHAEVKMTIIKRIAKAPRFVSGKCVKNYQEQLTLDFMQGTVLKTSRLGKLLPAVGCR